MLNLRPGGRSQFHMQRTSIAPESFFYHDIRRSSVSCVLDLGMASGGPRPWFTSKSRSVLIDYLPALLELFRRWKEKAEKDTERFTAILGRGCRRRPSRRSSQDRLLSHLECVWSSPSESKVQLFEKIIIFREPFCRKERNTDDSLRLIDHDRSDA